MTSKPRNRKVLLLGCVSVPLASIVAGVLLGSMSSSGSSSGSGDPGGRIMKTLEPFVRVFPGFDHQVPWSTRPTNGTYAWRIEPGRDSCDGEAGTYGWDPVVIQVQFQWTGSSEFLTKMVGTRLGALGFEAETTQPYWVNSGDIGGASWIRKTVSQSPVVVSLSAPIPGVDGDWLATIEAKPHGKLVGENC